MEWPDWYGGVGMMQTEANNLYYGQNKNMLVGGLTPGLTTIASFWLGDSYLNATRTPIFTSLPPVVTGNAASAAVTEGLNSLIEKWSNRSSQNANNGAKP
jgi:hypothetical protein